MLASRGICRTCHSKLISQSRFNTPPASTRQLSHRALSFTSSSSRPLVPRIRPQSAVHTSSTNLSASLRRHPGLLSQIRFQSTTPGLSSDIPLQTPPELLSDPIAIADAAQHATVLGNKSQPWEMGMFAGYYNFDFGWGTSTIMQNLFEWIHVTAGTEWWASILLTGVLVRVLMFPLVAMASNESAKLRAVSSLTTPIQEKMRVAMLQGNQLASYNARQELSQIRKDVGIKYSKMFWPMLQIPLGFGIFRQLRNMAWADVPGMSNEGMLWFQNLTVADPYFVLPVLTGIVQHMTMRTSFNMNSASMTTQMGGMQRILMYALPGVSVIFLSWIPACVGLNFFCTASIAYITNLILQTPATRNMLNMVPMFQPSSSSSSSPYKGVINVSSRVKTHPNNVQTEQERKTADTKFSDKFKPGNIKTTLKDTVKGASDSIRSTVMPEAKEAKKKHLTKAEKRKADQYERKRRREIEQERAEYEQRKYKS